MATETNKDKLYQHVQPFWIKSSRKSAATLNRRNHTHHNRLSSTFICFFSLPFLHTNINTHTGTHKHKHTHTLRQTHTHTLRQTLWHCWDSNKKCYYFSYMVKVFPFLRPFSVCEPVINDLLLSSSMHAWHQGRRGRKNGRIRQSEWYRAATVTSPPIWFHFFLITSNFSRLCRLWQLVQLDCSAEVII